MTDESTEGFEADPVESVAEPASETARGAQLDMGSGEGMVALGSLVLIGTWIIFGLFLNDYWIGWLALLFAVSAVLLLRVDKGFIEKLAPTAVLTKLLGYLLAIIGVFTLIEDVRFADGTLNEFPDVIGALAAYVGYVFAYLGARSIKT
jgi:hypothetical protein